MREEKYQPKMPDIMEAIFDAGYLIFDLIAAILFFTYAKGNTLFILYGILTLTPVSYTHLCGIAVVSAIFAAKDIEAATKVLKDRTEKMLK